MIKTFKQAHWAAMIINEKMTWWLSGKAQLPFWEFDSLTCHTSTHMVRVLYVWHGTSDVFLDVVSPPGDTNKIFTTRKTEVASFLSRSW